MPAKQSLGVLSVVPCDPRKEERENAEAFCGTLLDARLPPAKHASQRHNLRAVIPRFPSPCMSHWTSHPFAVKCQLKPNEFNSSDKFKLAPTETIICFELSPVMDHQFPNESTVGTFFKKKKNIY